MTYKELETFVWRVNGKCNDERDAILKRRDDCRRLYDERGAAVALKEMEAHDKVRKILFDTLYEYKEILGQEEKPNDNT